MHGLEIAAELKKRKWTLGMVAEKCGVTRQTVDNAIYDRIVSPNKKVIKLVADILNERPQDVKSWYSS